jgi:hypothetical protein
MTTFDIVVLQPAVKFTAVREKDPADNDHSNVVVEQKLTAEHIAQKFYSPVAT